MIVPSSFHINVLSLCVKGIYFELRTGRPHIGFEIKRFLTVDFCMGHILIMMIDPLDLALTII